MGTENAILAATLAEGTTRIHPTAQEPEVDDLIAFLCQMGAHIERPSPDTVVVNGQRRLRGATHRVLPDRIEAGTFVAAAAVTGGRVTLEGAPCDHLGAFLEHRVRGQFSVDDFDELQVGERQELDGLLKRGGQDQLLDLPLVKPLFHNHGRFDLSFPQLRA